MSSDDQVEAVEFLTRVASMTMGLREQMDVIRIINPEATVLPTDTEFEIGILVTAHLNIHCNKVFIITVKRTRPGPPNVFF